MTKVISVCRAEDSSPLTDRVRDDITLQVLAKDTADKSPHSSESRYSQ